MSDKEQAVVIDLPTPMVQIEEGAECPFLDCAHEGEQHLHFTNEAQKPLVDE